jgi:oxygen-dependent protoporphyrinogen oxidase
VAVIGAGVSGLAVARGLQARGVACVLLEASARPGGVLRSTRQGGRLLEWGPQRLRLTSSLRGLVDSLGLESELLLAPADSPLYVARDGRLHPVPRSLRTLLRTSLLSPGGRARLLCEPLTARVREDETVAAALRRKFGAEAYRVLLGPLFGGLYASDPANMRAADSLARFVERAGSQRSLLLRALRASAAAPAACSLREGVGVLPAAMAKELGATLRLEHRVETIVGDVPEPGGEDRPRAWRLSVDGRRPDAEVAGPFSDVVLAVPADRAARLLDRAAPAAAGRLSRLTYNRLAMVHMHARGAAIPGFGYQVAFGEPFETRGVTFNDALFGRAGVVTAFLGGARNVRLPGWSDERIAAVAETEFRGLCGRAATAIEVSRPRVPAYDMSWSALDGLRLPPGLHLCAGYLERAGVEGRLAQAERLVDRLA